VPTTLLAVDDSVTMRKVLEMTFAGEDYRVVTADSTDAALAKLRSDHPSIVLCDVSLDGQGGYGLCAKIKAESPGVAVLILASKQQPYDNQKGLSSRADDFIEKPFDTQQLVDKVKRLAGRPAFVEASPITRPGGPVGGPSTQPGVPLPAARPGSATSPLGGARPPLGTSPPLNPRPTAPGIGTSSSLPQSSVGRGTLAYGGYSTPSGPAATPSAGGSALPPAAGRPPAPLVSPQSPPAPTPPAPPAPLAHLAPPPAASAPAAAAGSVAAAVAANGQLAAKLQHLGLTEAQVSGVLALSREVVEKVVWEVVPVLAETMIKEEIKRLTSD
jgi:CheY-like chemotaxis protein